MPNLYKIVKSWQFDSPSIFNSNTKRSRQKRQFKKNAIKVLIFVAESSFNSAHAPSLYTMLSIPSDLLLHQMWTVKDG